MVTFNSQSDNMNASEYMVKQANKTQSRMQQPNVYMGAWANGKPAGLYPVATDNWLMSVRITPLPPNIYSHRKVAYFNILLLF